MAPTPLPVETPVSASTTPVASNDDRIRRNVACISCRNSKVRCKASPLPNKPCQRCAKLQISCVVDKGHKRVTKRSKLEQLEQELKSLKQVVQPKTNGDVSWTPPSPRHTLPSQPQEQRTPSSGLRLGATPQIPTPLPDHPTVASISSRASERLPKTVASQTRVLGDLVFTGDEIEWYWDKFLQYFHPFFPILRKRDPDECYEACPVLFWVIIFIACRRYCKDERVLNAVVSHVSKEIWTALSNPAMEVEAVHAALFLTAWPLTTIRFVTDPSTTYASIAMNACLLCGFHTGRGTNTQFCFASRGHVTSTDEEASSTWLACCTLAQLANTNSGLPPPAIHFNEEACKNVLSHGDWTELITMFDIQRFLNRFQKTICAVILAQGSVTEAMVADWEDEFEQFKALVVKHNSDIIQVMCLWARLQIQQYYLVGRRGTPNPRLRYLVARGFRTARNYIECVADLESRCKFLSHAPQWVFRGTLDAANIIIHTLHSTFAPETSPDEANTLAAQAYNALLRCSARPCDMPHRAGAVLETFWAAKHLIPKIQLPIEAWPDRLGAGIAFACARRIKDALHEARKGNENIGRRLEAIRKYMLSGEAGHLRVTNLFAETQGADGGAAAATGDTALQQDEPMPTASSDPFQDVDWSMFMEDFGWPGEDAVFMGLP